MDFPRSGGGCQPRKTPGFPGEETRKRPGHSFAAASANSPPRTPCPPRFRGRGGPVAAAPHSRPAFLGFRGRRPTAQMTTPSGDPCSFPPVGGPSATRPTLIRPYRPEEGRGSGFCCCMEPTCRIRLARSRRTTSKSTTSAPEPAGNRQFPCIKSCKPNTVLGSRFRDGPDSL